MGTTTEEMTERLIAHKTGELTSVMLHLGLRLGLLTAMARRGPVSARELAEARELHPRWVLEWLRQLTTAGLVEYIDEERFELPDALADLLIDADSTAYLGWVFQAPVVGAGVDRLAESFRTGIGMTWDDHGDDGVHMIAVGTTAHHRLLASEVLPLMDGVVERLEAGARAIDVGCGAGVAVTELARAFPKSTFLGIDPSPTAVERASQLVKESGLDNVEVRVAAAEDLDERGSFDLAMVLDCMHDMTHPEQAARAIRRALADDGHWLVKDIRTGECLRDNLEHPMAAMLYGVSIAFCMSSAMSTPDGAGLGTMGFSAKTARELSEAAGFERFRSLDYEGDPLNVFYEIRP